MHPNNKLKHKHTDTPLSLDTLPDPVVLKHQIFTFVGFYMLVYNALHEIKTMEQHVKITEKQFDDSLRMNKWLKEAEEHLPVWFSVRHLK